MCKYNYNVAILMSTFNGEKYIKEQIESIISQIDVNIHIYIRDDGSSDNTIQIIEGFMKSYPQKISLIKGKNIGFADSFYYLIKQNYVADFYAFSDQDDIWDSKKIISAINMISTNNPKLYFSNLNSFDINGNSKLVLNNNTIENYNRYYFIINGFGCTMVWNDLMHKILNKYDKPKEMTHDVWVNLIGHIFGDVMYDQRSFINYRIHENNACGATPKGIIQKLKKYYNFYFKKGKRLNLSLNCKYVIKLCPNVTNKMIHVLANYDKGILKWISSILFMIFKTDYSRKVKVLLLILFKKL